MENTTITETPIEEQIENTVEQSVATTEVISDATDEGEGTVSEGVSTETTTEGEGTVSEGISAEPTAGAERAEPVKAEKKTSTRKGKASKAKSTTTKSKGAVPAKCDVPAEVETSTKSKKDLKAEAHVKRCQEIAEEYKKLYPTVTEFHITPDYQVFLGENESAAKSHATRRGGEVQTIKFD